MQLLCLFTLFIGCFQKILEINQNLINYLYDNYQSLIDWLLSWNILESLSFDDDAVMFFFDQEPQNVISFSGNNMELTGRLIENINHSNDIAV